jgi:hypothetical protein
MNRDHAIVAAHVVLSVGESGAGVEAQSESLVPATVARLATKLQPIMLLCAMLYVRWKPPSQMHSFSIASALALHGCVRFLPLAMSECRKTYFLRSTWASASTSGRDERGNVGGGSRDTLEGREPEANASVRAADERQ